MNDSNNIVRTTVSMKKEIFELAKKNNIPFSETLREGIVSKIKELKEVGIVES